VTAVEHLTYLECEVVADALDDAARAIRAGFPDSPLPARGIRALLQPAATIETLAARRNIEWAAQQVERHADAHKTRARALRDKGGR
jgi:hypothetical protein